MRVLGNIDQRTTFVPGADAIGPLQAALGNWVTFTGVSGDTQTTPHSQSGVVTVAIAAIVLKPQVSGLFYVSLRCAFSTNGVEGDVIDHQFLTTQTAGPGVLSGTNQGFHGALAIGASGSVQATDAAGGTGLTIDGTPLITSGASLHLQHKQETASLAGQQTSAAASTLSFGFTGIVGLEGVDSNVKTPFVLGLPVTFFVDLNEAGNTISYQSFEMSAIELPFA